MARFSNPFSQFFSDSGRILPGAQLFFYVNGTTTPQATYEDAAFTVLNQNPVICDSAGRVPNIYMPDDDIYSITLKDASGSQIAQADDITGANSEVTSAEVIAALAANTDPVIINGSDIDLNANTEITGTLAVSGQTTLQSQIDIGGNASGPASGRGQMGAGSTNGLQLLGNGSTYDTHLANRIGQVALGVVANTQNVDVNGDVTVDGTSASRSVTIANTGNGNTSALMFERERQAGTGVLGAGVWVASDTSTNDTTLILAANTAISPTPYASLGSTSAFVAIKRFSSSTNSVEIGNSNFDVTGGSADFSGDATVNGFLGIGTFSEVTISSGAITATKTYHLVDTEGNAPTDDLTTINGLANGRVLVLNAASSTRTVVLRDGTGNLQLNGDFSLTNQVDSITLYGLGAFWVELSRSDNGT